MILVDFLSTFVIVSIGLGSAIFVLVAILPAILPSARTAALKDLEELEAKLATSKAGDFEETRRRVREISQIGLRLDSHLTDFRSILKAGFLAAALFFFAGLAGLVTLGMPRVYDSLGTAHVAVAESADWIIGVPFALGLMALLWFGGAFYRIASLFIKSAMSGTKPEAQEPSGFIYGKP